MESRQRRWVRAWIALTAVLPVLAAAFGVSAILLPSSVTAAQSIPYKLNFQGRLTDNNGNVLADGSYNIKFKLYSVSSGGSNVYAEDRVYNGAGVGPAPGANDNRVTIANGLFNIQFGDVTALSPSLFAGTFPLYLEVELPTPASATCASVGCASFTEGAMTPRQPLASSAYAFNADTVDGIDGASLAQLSPGTAQSGFLNVSGAISSGGTVSGVGGSFSGTVSGSALTATGAIQGATASVSAANGLTLGSTTAAGGIIFSDGTTNARAVTLTTTGLGASYSLTLPTAAPTLTQCLQSSPTTASQLVFGACGGIVTLQNAYNNSSDPEIALGAGATKGFTIRDNATTVGNILEVQNSGGTTTYLAVTATGVNVAGTLGVTGAISGNSVLSATLDAASASTPLAIGTGNASTITIGKAGVGISVPGGLTTSGGTINSGAGSITTTGALSGGAITGTSLGLGAGNLTTTGTITGVGSGLTSLNPSNLVTGSGAVTLQPAASAGLALTTTGTGGITVNAGSGGIASNLVAGATASYTATAAMTADLLSLTNTSATLAPTADGINLLQQTFYGKPSGTNAESSTRINVTNANTAAGGQVQGLRIVATGAGGAIASDTDGIFIDALAASSTGGTENALEIGAGWDAGFFIQSGGNVIQTATDSQFAFDVKNAAGSRILTVDTEATTDPLEVQVGQSSVIDAIQVNLGLDSSNVFTETQACTTTSNQGALYYNTASAAVRGCINGGWEDVVTTAGLGILAFGIIPDSGLNPGDIASLTTLNTATGPCQPYRSAAAVIGWTACTAYSGGRKVVVSAGTLATTNAVTGNFQHLCLNGASGAPALTTSAAETVNLAFNAANPVVCLADIRFGAANATMSQIYDTRVYTNSVKQFAYTAAAMANGRIAITTGGKVTNSNTAAAGGIAGVIGLTNGGTVGTNGAPNAILVTSGTVPVKLTTTIITAGQYVQSSATAGYGTATATAPTTVSYNTLGYAITANSTTCTTQINCFGSAVTNMVLR